MDCVEKFSRQTVKSDGFFLFKCVYGIDDILSVWWSSPYPHVTMTSHIVRM